VRRVNILEKKRIVQKRQDLLEYAGVNGGIGKLTTPEKKTGSWNCRKGCVRGESYVEEGVWGNFGREEYQDLSQKKDNQSMRRTRRKGESEL